MNNKNYSISRTGFTVEDRESGHILQVQYENEAYMGVVIMPEQAERLPLGAWNKGENPFEDDNSFEGMQTGYAPNGYWWFKIRPTNPFSEIMREVETFQKNGGLFSKLFRPKTVREEKLTDIVLKINSTGYVFADIMNDMGESAEDIMRSTASIRMAYGYARRSAATALHLQGLIDADEYDHNISMFKALQMQTEHSVEFQEQSFSDSIEFMQTYNHIITRKLIKHIIAIAMNFEAQNEQLSDSELVAAVIDSYTP